MATCPRCGAELGEPMPLACRNCGKIFALTQSPDSSAEASAPPPETPLPTQKVCAACKTPLTSLGQLSFRVGGYQGGSAFFLGQWGEMAEKLQPFALYHCPRCGKIEFYESGQ